MPRPVSPLPTLACTGRLMRLCLVVCALMAAGHAWATHPGRVEEIESRLRGRPEDAVAALDELLPRTNGRERMLALRLRGAMLIRLSDYAAAEKAAQELEQMAATSYAPAEATAMAQWLRARAVARGGPASRADRLFAEALAGLPADAPPALRLLFVDQRAQTQQNLGKLDVAVALYQDSVALADRVGVTWQRAEQRGSLAYALMLAQQHEAALKINEEGLALAQAAADLFEQSNSFNIRGIVLSEMPGRGQEVLAAWRESLELARRAGAKRQQGLLTANLADHYLRHDDPATALALAQQALPLAREVKDWSSESVALTNAGLATIALGRPDEGQALVKQALALEDSAGALTQKLAIQSELGHALEKAGLLKEAWTTLSEHRRAADEMFQRQHQQAVLELQEGLDAERRQRDMATMQTQNRLTEAQLTQRDLQQSLWAAAALAATLLLAVVVLLLRRVRASNAALRNSNALLSVASERDPLTGLANRRHLLQVMQQGPAQQGFEGSMLLIDIDHFKRINDEHGHATGDQVLVEVARRLRGALREHDLTVRWGGEEFLVVVRAMPQVEVEALAQRLLAGIGQEPVGLGSTRLSVTASIGFATFPLAPLNQPLSWERAIDLVDTAMYLAKAHGRNRAYGVRALHGTDAADAAGATQPTVLENAWRSGRAELAQLAGPEVVS